VGRKERRDQDSKTKGNERKEKAKEMDPMMIVGVAPELNSLWLCCASDRWSLGADRPSLAANDDNLVFPEAEDCGERIYSIFVAK
jgi:hypothetical protein